MGRFEIEDGRAATAPIQGGRLGEVVEKPQTLTLSEVLQTARSNRKQHRLYGEDGKMLRRIVDAIDSMDDIDFSDSRALLIAEARMRIANGDNRVGKLLGINVDSIKEIRDKVGAEERREFFQTARQRIANILDSK